MTGEMTPFHKGRYIVRAANGPADMAAVYNLRKRCFGAFGGTQDRFDTMAEQVLVETAANGSVVASFRMTQMVGAQIGQSYAAQYYDLSALAAYAGRMLELGRFCIDPDHSDPDILRVAWAALTGYVDGHGIELLFGCSSFQGTDPRLFLDAFALLKARHLAPARWAPQIKSSDVFPYAAQAHSKPDVKEAHAAMPPLLRSYLLMGGWVSDHAVIDHAMNTLHVFTALEIGAIPPARKKLLRALV